MQASYYTALKEMGFKPKPELLKTIKSIARVTRSDHEEIMGWCVAFFVETGTMPANKNIMGAHKVFKKKGDPCIRLSDKHPYYHEIEMTDAVAQVVENIAAPESISDEEIDAKSREMGRGNELIADVLQECDGHGKLAKKMNKSFGDKRENQLKRAAIKKAALDKERGQGSIFD